MKFTIADAFTATPGTGAESRRKVEGHVRTPPAESLDQSAKVDTPDDWCPVGPASTRVAEN